ncbi:penicillin-binding protein 1C [Methyloglobulus sp.]|uniref:penicillin-binding protein 1C n=1 Tax=Methyloglobulus sp. TaxID=2518622 RepID=UPI0032B84611
MTRQILFQLPPKPLSNYSVFSTAIYARHGELLRLTLASDQQYRLWMPLTEIPKTLQNGTILYEDRWFYRHLGFNPLALLRSAWMSYGRGAHQGGSTITMQVARQLYRIDSRNPLGKLRQIAAAVWLELRYSKDDILEAYLNTAPYGGNTVGVAAASLLYFHKPVSQLTLTEALTLAVIPQNPKQRFPNKRSSQPGLPSALQQAKLRLWRNWLAEFPQDKRYAADFALPLTVYSKADKPFLAPHLTDLLLRQYPHVQHIHSSIDSKTQLSIKQSVDNYLQQNRSAGIRNSAVLLLDAHTMQVRALIGSANYWNIGIKGQVNGTLAKRSPGSTLKPFIYALALDQGLLHPRTVIADTPTSFGPYNPENFDSRFLGPITVQDALIRSRNIPALNTVAKLKQPSLYGFLQQAGISGLKPEQHYGLSLALGGGEVTMLELVQLYAMLPNQGRLRTVHYRVDLKQPTTSEKALLSPASAFITLDMLSHNPRPDSKRPAYPKVAWKTGTSWGFKDAWSVGIAGHYVLAVWVGNFDNQGNAAFTGIKAAGSLFFSLIDSLRNQQLLEGLDVELLPPKPESVSQVNVCAASGDLPNEDCPSLVKTWFIPGKSPIKTSRLHKAVYFNAKGEVICKGQPYRHREIYEFWSNDMALLFHEAGLPRRQPPTLPSCYDNLNGEAELEIVSPSSIGVYTLKIGKPSSIGLKAKSKINGNIFWFANKSLIGKAKATETLSWMPENPGTYRIRAADEQGHSASKEITVTFVP